MTVKNLCCPICGTSLGLSENGRSLICQKEIKPHCFDLASAGYVNLDRQHSGGGDSKECVKSRSAFLALGHYEPISKRINELASNFCLHGGNILDAGCGEGYYTLSLANVLSSSPVFGVDISKPAIEHAAKEAKKSGAGNLFYSVSSIYELPLQSGSVDCITNIFAPCPEKEFFRVLRDGGVLIVAAAGEKHLLGLKKALYDNVYMNETRADMPKNMGFSEEHISILSYSINLKSQKEISDLFSMTPYYYRTSLRDKEKLASLKQLETRIEIEFTVYRKNG